MKISKGNAGYINSRKKRVLVKSLVQFGISFALLAIGMITTDSRMNLLTVVAILGCLPASKTLVEYIMLFSHHSLALDTAKEIASKTENIIVVYDMVFTSEHEIMPVECIAVSGNTICGFASNPKTDVVFTAQHIKKYLNSNGFTDVSVKIFDNYTAFVTRAEGMQNIAVVEKKDTKQKEEKIANVILNISL